MALSPGTRLGPYEILGIIGAGGMGEVYRATDTRLHREVAVKVSAERFSDRFEREARAVAALNHPNICTLHDVGPNYLVMELVDGDTLAERINLGAIPLEEALVIARQIADALDAAHEKGVVHRDLKPGNIKIKPDGAVKVLDFGLAKMREPAQSSDPANSPTLTLEAATLIGAIMGTAGYMAPEQAKGKAVDKRADIFAFGVVLYEMLVGIRLFDGETVSETLASVLKEEPDLERVPTNVRRLLGRCLEKDPRKRLRDIGDVWQLLDAVDAAAPQAASLRYGWVWPAAAALFVVTTAALAFLHFRETPPETPILRATLLAPENTTFDFATGRGLLALSPDGRRIVFGARTTDGKNPLWVRLLDGLTAQPLAGTDGALFPFWSPDSRFIGFFADGKLKKIDASGGATITLADASLGRGGSWSQDGVIVFAPSNSAGPLLRVSAAGGAATPVSSEQGRLPWFLPDGRHFLFMRSANQESIQVGSLDGAPSKTVGQAGSNTIYAQGSLLFLREGTLMAQPFDAKRLVTTGEAVPVAERVEGVLISGSVGVFSASSSGLLAYHGGQQAGGQILTWFDRSGKQVATLGDPANIGSIQFSPDRKSVAAGIQDRGNFDIWIYDVARGIPTRFTFDPAIDRGPVWSPDGRTIVFSSNRKGHFDLYRRSASGAGVEELLYADNLNKDASSWSADGKSLLYDAVDPKTSDDIWALPLTPERPGSQLRPSLVIQTPFREGRAQLSPDGRWIAYMSNESQRIEVYVAPFPGPGGKRQVSNAGGFQPRWRQDGKEIFYVGPDRRLMAAAVTARGDSLEIGEVRPLFGPIPTAQGQTYDVSADGQRFLVPVQPAQKSQEPLTLVENWAAGLKK